MEHRMGEQSHGGEDVEAGMISGRDITMDFLCQIHKTGCIQRQWSDTKAMECIMRLSSREGV